MQGVAVNQDPDKAILDVFGKQCYLGNAYTISLPEINLATTTETNLVYISNPASVLGKSLFVNLRRVASDLQAVDFRFYVNPTVTANGTAKTPVNLRPATGKTSVSSCFQGPTTSAKGTLIQNMSCPQSYYVIADSSLLIILDPGQSLLATGIALTANTNINIDISWYEI